MSEEVGVTEGSLLFSAELVGDGVDRIDAWDAGSRVLNDLAILDIDAADLGESTGRGVVVRQELGDNGEGFAGVNGEVLAEEVLVTHAEGVEVATVTVAKTGVPRTLGVGAASLSGRRARMGSVGGGIVVSFPDIHLRAASAIAASSGVGAGTVPPNNVSL